MSSCVEVCMCVWFFRAFSFNLEGQKKTWILVDPVFSPLFRVRWSGASFVATIDASKSNKVAALRVDQDVGDVLWFPQWYLHQTRFERNTSPLTSISINTHSAYGMAGFLSVVAAEFGFTTLFYTIFG